MQRKVNKFYLGEVQKVAFCMRVCSVISDLCDLTDCSPSGFSVHGLFQARILEWVTVSYSRGSSHCMDLTTSPALAGGFFTIVTPGKPMELSRGGYS